MVSQFNRDNHYVPKMYLKQWESSYRKVWTYRTLVSHENIPMWKENSFKGIAYHSHLYTRVVSGIQSDEIERWFGKYETQAEESIRKVISEERLTSADWESLVNFLAVQDIRTPARLLEHIQRWNKELPDLLKSSIDGVISKKNYAASDKGKQGVGSSIKEPFPLRITTEIKPGEYHGILKAETFAGRSTWMYSMKKLLSNRAEILHQHKWTVISPSKGLAWITSDDPVIRLNYYNPRYDFLGGWGNTGTEIFLPLSPKHLLYAQVGKRPPRRGSRLTPEMTRMFRRFIAEHAHRLIFSDNIDLDVEILRPRSVDSILVQKEREQWNKWHEDQTVLEKELL